MKTESGCFRSPGKCLCFSILLNLGILISLLVLFRPFFETNDDTAIALYVNGAKGTYDPHLVYVNYLFGLLLSVLYRFRDTVPWYALLQYTLLFCAFTAILYGMARRLRNASAVWITLIVLYFFAYDGYIRLQYTKTAGIVSAAGIFLLLYAAQEERIAWKALICGYVLACSGFMYREQQFLAELAVMSGIGVCLLLGPGRAGRALVRKRLLHCVGIFAVLLALVAGLHVLNSRAYRDPEWQDYLEFHELRVELFDYGFPDYDANEEAYQALGISRNAYRLYRGWNYVDTEKFTVEVMRKLIALKKPRSFGWKMVKDFLREVPPRLFLRDCFYCFLLVFFFWILWGRHTKGVVLSAVYEAAVLGAVYLYLYYTGRYLYNRVDVGLWLAGVLVMLWMYEREKSFFSNKAGAAFLFSVLCLTQGMWKNTWRVYGPEKDAQLQSMRNIVEELRADTGHMYLVKMGTVTFSGAYGPFDPMPRGVAENILALGGWPALTPRYCELLASYGVTNPYRDVVDNDRVYLLDQNIEATMKYIRKYYDKSADAELVAEYSGYNAYRIVSGN